MVQVIFWFFVLTNMLVLISFIFGHDVSAKNKRWEKILFYTGFPMRMTIFLLFIVASKLVEWLELE